MKILQSLQNHISFALMLISITQVNESEIPLLHEFNGVAKENGTSIEVCTKYFNIFVTHKFCIVVLNDSTLNHRRRDACYMLQ